MPATSDRLSKWQRRRRLDELRLLSGLPQQTRFHFATLPPQLVRILWRLRSVYNYFADPSAGSLNTLYYDASTRRSPREHLYERRYGITFREAL